MSFNATHGAATLFVPQTIVNLGSVSTTVNIDASLGSIFTVTTTASTITWAAPTNPTLGQVITISNLQSGYSTPGYTINAIWKVANASSAFSSSATGQRGVFSFFYDGTNWIETSGLAGIA